MAFRALILDMDGTMVDTERTLVDLWEDVAGEMGHPFSRDVLISTVGTTYEETERIMQEAYPGAPHEAIREEVSRRFAPMRDRGEVPVKPGIRELLERAREMGLRVGVCTSTHRASTEKTLAAAGLLSFIDDMVCGGEAERGKPDPAPYLLMAKRLGADPQGCLVVEDSPHGAMSALDAGMTVVVIPDMTEPPEEIRRRVAVLPDAFGVLEMFFLR